MEKCFTEVFTLQIASYAAIPFKAEIYADELLVDWDDGRQSLYKGQEYYLIDRPFASEGMRQIRISGKNISYVNVAGQNLCGIMLENCPMLDYLDCSANEISVLDLKNCPLLQELYCNSNNLPELDLSHNPEVFLVEASYNELETIDLRPCDKLSVLHCPYNHLASLEIAGCGLLSDLNISSNNLPEHQIARIFEQLPIRDRKANAVIRCHDNPGLFDDCLKALWAKNWH